ncbi:DUF3499 domain-containing protein [Mycobacteroides franklinii]|uniref:DUF3499 domain-containing protein n=1 Tax=Mycobacteroides franklinii TaxID=948102 RepID=A0A4V3A5H7_9MYCO|nr:DUF3499 domain-containing protein [Mycobacteroides franklinii]ORA58740.1 hypothetical protein BST24_19940 [Mycobacteroides franklinii]TDH17680.1 DUF3499 domain-containing protein [Mycobacteroides franklinii]
MRAPRRCCRPGCPSTAVATLTFVYADSTAVVGPLATSSEPHSWDLCAQHASRITAPRGWELVRYNGPLPSNPEDDDLVALADAVREPAGVRVAAAGFSEPAFDVSSPAPNAAPRPVHPAPVGRRRGHLRVLPDPSE